MSNAEPAKGAEITIQRPGEAAIGPFRADESGFVVLPPSVFTPVTSGTERGVIVVRSGDDWTYKHLEDTLDAWRFDTQVDTSPDRPFGLVFTDRGIYRPGDTVHVKGIFRKEGNPGTITPAGAAVELKVEGPDGDAILERKETLSPLRHHVDRRGRARTGRLGTYSIRATVGEGTAGLPRRERRLRGRRVPPRRVQGLGRERQPVVRPRRQGAAGPRAATTSSARRWRAPRRASRSRAATLPSRPPGIEGFAVDDEDVFHAGSTDRSTARRRAPVEPDQARRQGRGERRGGARDARAARARARDVRGRRHRSLAPDDRRQHHRDRAPGRVLRRAHSRRGPLRERAANP